MSRGAFRLVLIAFVCATGCNTNDPSRCSGWNRFVASLEQRPLASCDDVVPSENPQGITGSVSPCSSTGADTCTACIADACCAEAQACTDETSCECSLLCRVGGATDANCAAETSCTALPDATYAALTACIDNHCAAQCPRLQ